MRKFIKNKLSVVIFLAVVSPANLSITCSECDDGDPLLNDPGIQQAFFELWQNSGTDLPLHKRSEQGAWIVHQENSGYKVIPFPGGWLSTPCEIMIPDNFYDVIPENIVSVVHTHPFNEGDDTTPPDVCGSESTESYISGGNIMDHRFLIQIANHLSDYCLKSYVIDGENIISMTTLGTLTYYPVQAVLSEIY
ncbi:MAG: hypothetical protein WEA56_02550 [Balneolaceae bacterium]